MFLILGISISVESKKYTLLALAYECGFNSKSTFNKHFKENTGKTPTAYINTKC